MSTLSGTCCTTSPFLKVFSLSKVSSVFKIAGLAFQISSKKANSALGK